MGDDLLFGIRRHLVPVPGAIWKKEIAENAHHSAAHHQFMSEDHHLVRDFVVRELPHAGKPLPPEWIAQNLGLTTDRVISILGELERNMTFLYRNNQGAVTWAYPVTVDTTPHKVQFSSGEKIYAA